MSKSREQLNDMLREINIEGKVVLDVGVQDKPTRRLTKGTPKLYVTLDIDPQWKPDIVADLNDNLVTNQLEAAQHNCDVIFCIEVLEHCWNPIRVLKNLFAVVRPGGVVYISTPFINPHHDVVDYLRFTDEWYQKAMKAVGFEEITIRERRATTGLEALQHFYTLEGMKYSKIRAVKGRYTYPVGYFVSAKRPYAA